MSDRGRQDAVAVWKAAVAAVDSEQLVRHTLAVDGNALRINGQRIPLSGVTRIEVVGAGKAGAGMARAAEQVLSALPSSIDWSGWINVPDDCVESLEHITLHGARPAGVNEPTPAAADGTAEILRRVSGLGPADLCLVLLSGGGSALLPAPSSGIRLEEKLAVTRLLASSGASIQELNTVRSRISDVKGGGLARACSGGQMWTLIISDIIGDPLDLIASGPTCCDAASWSQEPLEVLQKYDPELTATPMAVISALQSPVERQPPTCEVHNEIIGSNHVALSAAAARAAELGYDVQSWGSENAGTASELGRRLFGRLTELQKSVAESGRPVCVLAGGETTVVLCDAQHRGKGGRNQEIVLSAMADHPHPEAWRGLTLLSGGTDGEDGPTPAAGAVAAESVVTAMNAAALDPESYLQTNNAWPFFDQLDALLTTGPTHTNVMDVQVGIVLPPEA